MGAPALPAHWPSGDSYSQWIRRVIGASRDRSQPLYPLFDSSTAEPGALLTDLIAEAFAAPVSSRYLSAFSGGNPAVMFALAARYRVPESRILCTAGATSALGILYRTYTQSGDHILVEAPGFDLFTDIAASTGVEASTFARARDGSIDLDALAGGLRANTRLIVLSNLHNPTGMLLDDDSIRAIAALAEARGIDVIVDEVYREYAAAPGTTAAHLAPNIITINSLTKVYGLSGLRCGWIIADASRIERIRIVHSRLEFGVSKIAHTVAALVLENTAPFEAHWRGLLDVARPVVASFFRSWIADGLIDGALPAHGCICFPRLIGISDTRAFSEDLAARHGVVVAPGEYFDAPGHVRIGFSAAPAALEAALGMMEEALSRRRPRIRQTAMV